MKKFRGKNQSRGGKIKWRCRLRRRKRRRKRIKKAKQGA